MFYNPNELHLKMKKKKGEGHEDTQGRRSCEHGDIDWYDLCLSHSSGAKEEPGDFKGSVALPTP